MEESLTSGDWAHTRSIKKSLGKGLFAIENDDEGHPCVCGIHLKVYQSTPDVPSMPENHLDQVPVTSLREALADPDVVVTSTPERCHSKPRQHFLPFVQIFNPKLMGATGLLHQP